MSNELVNPEEYFGFRLGSDRNIARWDKITEYFQLLGEKSDKIKVVNMGPSTMGNPFLLCVISSPENLANLEHLREINLKISDPRGLTEEEVKQLIGEGKAVICQSMSLHATEIGGTQMAPELTYELLTREDEETQRILDNVVLLMVPCFNPDGQIMVTDWYYETLGTEYEGVNQPFLYHKYTGHDNNRDGFMTNMIESKYMAKLMFRDWVPQAYMDHHHCGSYGARFYVPPYTEPIHPHGDPLVWREHLWYGAHIGYKLEEQRKSGAATGARYLGWGHLGFHWITIYHNIAGMLTESACAKLATPLYIHPDQLVGDERGPIRDQPIYGPQTNFPHPWPGGWWKLRDIVEQQKIAAWGVLDQAARNKETVLWNAYQKAKTQTEHGACGTPLAYVIPLAQHDPLTADKMVNNLLIQGVEMMQAKTEFSDGHVTYPAGSYIVSLEQPKMGLIKTLLGRTLYPDNAWTREPDGSPSKPQDAATDTMAEFMGVRVDPVECILDGEFEKLSGYIEPKGVVEGEASSGYAFTGSLNDSFKAYNMLVDNGVAVKRVDEMVEVDGCILLPGDFIAEATSEAVEKVADATGVSFTAVPEEPSEGVHKADRRRIGMYQRYWGGNMDEGWTRWIFEQFGFPYTTIMDAEIKKGALNEKYDVIVLPDDSTALIVGDKVEEHFRKSRPNNAAPEYPPEYRSGIGAEGVEAIKDFVQKGGTLVTLGGSCGFAIEKLGLKLRKVPENVPKKEFFCPGSTLKTVFDTCNPLAYGMPEEGLALFWNNSAFDIIPTNSNESISVVARYGDRDILQSGWLIGEKHIAGKPAVMTVKVGEGSAVLIGFRCQNRGQTHGTFKLLFNALLG